MKLSVSTCHGDAKNRKHVFSTKKLPFGVIFICFLFSCAVFSPLCCSAGNAQAAGDGDPQTMAKKVIDLVNGARLKGARCGNRYFKPTRPVVWNSLLAQASHKHSRDMAGKEYMGHTGSDDSGPGDRIARLGYKWMAYGENVCEGYATPEEAVKAWLKSQEHCENIMNPGFGEAGAAYAKGTERIYWTLVLATPESSSNIP